MTPSIRTRYSQKLAASGLVLGISTIPLFLLPRALSPESLGNADLITSVGASLFCALSFGVPAGFTTWSARYGIPGAVAGMKFLTKFMTCLGLAAFCLVLIASIYLSDQLTKLLPNASKDLVFLGIVFAWLTFVFQTLGQVFDSLALTKQSEVLRVMQSVLRATMCLGLFVISMLNPSTWLAVQSLALVLAILGYWIIWRNGRKDQSEREDPGVRDSFLIYMKKFMRNFSIYSLFGMFFEIGDRFILQIFSGAVQQGYFSYALRLTSVITVFTAAFVPILQREFAAHAGTDSNGRLRILLERNKVLVSIVSLIAIFLAMFSQFVVRTFGTTSFNGSIPIFAVLALTPIHQTMGQLTNFLLVSVGRLKTYTTVGIVFMVSSLAASYCLLAAPTDFIPGAGLGAFALAVKLLLFQFLFNNIYLYYLCRVVGSSFSSWLLFQILGPIAFAIFAFLAKGIVESCLGNYHPLAALISGFAIYLVCVVALLVHVPKLFGLSECDFRTVLLIVRRRFRGKFG